MDQVVSRPVSLREVFNDRRVLVTGDTGFKGSWLSLWLEQLGAQVLGFALAPQTDNDHYNLLGLGERIEHVTGDIRDLAAIQGTVDRFQPEVVFHLAAQALVRYSYANPRETFETNVAGSVNVLESVRGCGAVKALVYATSDKCYRNREWLWGYRENDELGGHDPYSASKAAAELVMSSYQDSFFRSRQGFGAASVRAGNVIGGGDWAADRIVPDSIRALQRGESILIRNPNSTRPWQHVLEPLSGYLLTAARLLEDPQRYAGPWNFGPDAESIRTVVDLANMIVAQWGSGNVTVRPEAGAPHEAGLLHLNCDKARQVLRWQPRWNAERAIAETVSWYSGVHAGAKAIDVSSRQIAAYMESE